MCGEKEQKQIQIKAPSRPGTGALEAEPWAGLFLGHVAAPCSGRQEQGGSEGELCIFLRGSLLWSFNLKAEFQLHDQ